MSCAQVKIEASKLVNKLDANGDGEISYEEFEVAAASHHAVWLSSGVLTVLLSVFAEIFREEVRTGAQVQREDGGGGKHRGEELDGLAMLS